MSHAPTMGAAQAAFVLRPEYVARFLRRVIRAEGCWTWNGSHSRTGYAQVRVRHVNVKAPRVAWVIANRRPIPDGLHILHSCDNRGCLRPDHLRVGTRADNLADRNVRHRARKKLTAENVYAIRALEGLETNRVIGARFGVEHSMVSMIHTRRCWAHLPEQPVAAALAAGDALVRIEASR